MIKKIIFLISLFSLASCDYSPLYSSKKNNFLNIETVEYEGDRKINSILKNRLRNHKNANVDPLKIKIISEYDKKDLSKDNLGNIETYQLSVKIEFIINSKNFGKIITLEGNSKMQNFNDKFEEKDYENRLKENMTNSIYENLIIQLTRK